MLTPAMRNWFGRSSRSTVTMLLEPTLILPAERAPEPDKPPEAPWHKGRLAVTDALWGDGYILPGGEVELLRLAKPLGLSAAASLLLLGAGTGGAACSLVTALGVWVNGFEADPDLVAAATQRVASGNLGKRARIDLWNPADPSFSRHYYHHALALEPLMGHLPEAILAAIAAALKPGGSS